MPKVRKNHYFKGSLEIPKKTQMVSCTHTLAPSPWQTLVSRGLLGILPKKPRQESEKSK